MAVPGDTKNIVGVEIFNGSREQLLAHLEAVRQTVAPQPVALFYGNSNLFQTYPESAQRFASNDVVVANDGVALDAVALLLTGSRFRENLNGTDFTPYLIEQAESIQSVFTLGGRPGIARRAGEALQDSAGVRLAGSADGFEEIRQPDICDIINASQADILLVALGNPLQEQWILENRARLQVKYMVGVGALLDFLAGEFRRAPLWIQKLKLEWAYRLMQEPGRLARRYSIDMLRFFVLCLRYRQQNPDRQT